MPHIARQLGHDVALPQRRTCLAEEPQPATHGGLQHTVTPNRRKVGLKVSPIDTVTLSDGEDRENARGAAVLVGCTVKLG